MKVREQLWGRDWVTGQTARRALRRATGRLPWWRRSRVPAGDRQAPRGPPRSRREFGARLARRRRESASRRPPRRLGRHRRLRRADRSRTGRRDRNDYHGYAGGQRPVHRADPPWETTTSSAGSTRSWSPQRSACTPPGSGWSTAGSNRCPTVSSTRSPSPSTGSHRCAKDAGGDSHVAEDGSEPPPAA